MEESNVPISGIAIAVLAESDFTLYDGFPANEALASAWTTLLVSADWFTKATVKFNGPTSVSLQLDLPGSVDPQWGASFAAEVSQRATRGIPAIPPIAPEHINSALYVISGITTQFVRSYSELSGLSFETAVDQLRTAYVGSLTIE